MSGGNYVQNWELAMVFGAGVVAGILLVCVIAGLP